MYTWLAKSRLLGRRDKITGRRYIKLARLDDARRRYVASRAFACARARPERHFSKQYTASQHTNQRAHVSHTPYIRVLELQAFSRATAAALSLSRASPPPPSNKPINPSVSLFHSCRLYSLLPSPTFFSSSQRQFFRTHTPPWINNSPYEFTRKRVSERVRARTDDTTRDETRRACGRAGGQRRLDGEQHAFLSRRCPARARRNNEETRTQAHTTATTARGESSNPNLHVSLSLSLRCAAPRSVRAIPHRSVRAFPDSAQLTRHDTIQYETRHNATRRTLVNARDNSEFGLCSRIYEYST